MSRPTPHQRRVRAAAQAAQIRAGRAPKGEDWLALDGSLIGSNRWPTGPHWRRCLNAPECEAWIYSRHKGQRACDACARGDVPKRPRLRRTTELDDLGYLEGLGEGFMRPAAAGGRR